MSTEDRQEFVGHLKAELLDARELFTHSRISEADYLGRIVVIRRRAEAARTGKAQYQIVFAALAVAVSQ